LSRLPSWMPRPADPTHVRAPRLAGWGAIVAFWTSFALSALAAAEAARRPFDLPAEDAARSLKRFSLQSGADVVFASGLVTGVKTRAVKGGRTPREALPARLAATQLVATQDAATGAFMINRVHDPNGARAAQAPSSGDRPRQNDSSDHPPPTMNSS